MRLNSCIDPHLVARTSPTPAESRPVFLTSPAQVRAHPSQQPHLSCYIDVCQSKERGLSETIRLFLRTNTEPCPLSSRKEYVILLQIPRTWQVLCVIFYSTITEEYRTRRVDSLPHGLPDISYTPHSFFRYGYSHVNRDGPYRNPSLKLELKVRVEAPPPALNG